MWESCVDKLVEILLCEGGDVELRARTSKHIRVFAIDPLSLTLSLFCIVPYIISYCSFIYYMLDLFVCASLVLNHESFIQRLNSYSEESRGVSPEPFTGNSATLVSCIKCSYN